MNTQLDTTIKIYWSNEDNCFVCISPFYTDVIGVGNTTKEAYKVYLDLLEIYKHSSRIR